MQADFITLTQRQSITKTYSTRVSLQWVGSFGGMASHGARTWTIAPMSAGVAEVALHIFCSVATLSLLSAGSAGPLPSGYFVPFVWGKSQASLSRKGTWSTAG